MKLNSTSLEVALFLVVSISIYVWSRYGKRIQRWWEELWKRQRGRQQLKSVPM